MFRRYKDIKSDYLKIRPLTGGREYVSVSMIAKEMNDDIHVLADLSHPYKNRIYELFPKKPGVNRSKLMINKVGVYSLTKPQAVEQITDVVKQYMDPRETVMVNATAGIGGDIINHYDKFKFIYGYEISNTQYTLLKNNCEVYGITNVELFNLDYTTNINKQESDIVMVDPPWGGLDYRDHKSLELKLGDLTMSELADAINAKLVLLKLLINNDLSKFGKHEFHKIGNYMLVVIDKREH